MASIQDVEEKIKLVFDPEIPVNVFDLGLIYDIGVDGSQCNIKMTLTSQSCPSAQDIPDWIKRKVNTLDDIDTTEIEVVWEPTWSPQLITPEGRKILGIEDDAVPGGEEQEEDEF